jgi:hypothetical protein
LPVHAYVSTPRERENFSKSLFKLHAIKSDRKIEFNIFSTLDSDNMVDTRTCKVEATLAPLAMRINHNKH